MLSEFLIFNIISFALSIFFQNFPKMTVKKLIEKISTKKSRESHLWYVIIIGAFA